MGAFRRNGRLQRPEQTRAGRKKVDQRRIDRNRRSGRRPEGQKSRQNGYIGASSLMVIHRHTVYSSRSAGPPIAPPFPEAPRPPNGLVISSLTVWSLIW